METDQEQQGGRTLTIRALLTISMSTLLLGGLLAWLIVGRPQVIGIDDANITMVFASNIAHGYGYVFSPGQERIEGSTSLLWTAIVTLVHLADGRPETPLLFLCIAFTVVTIFCLYCVFDRLVLSFTQATARPILVLAYAVYVVSCVPIFFWSVLSLMDTSLWLMVGTIFVAFILLPPHNPVQRVNRRSRVFGFTLGLVASATRPEALPLMGITLLVPAALEANGTRWSKRLLGREAALTLGLVIGTAALTAFRLSYFGVPFPNTFYAKVSSNPFDNLASGGKYIVKFILEDGISGWFLLAAVAAAFVILQARQQKGLPPTGTWGNDQPFLIFVTLSWIFVVILAQLFLGGDHFTCYRFFVPIMPLLPIPALFLLTSQTSWLSKKRLALVPLVVLLVFARQTYFYARQQPVGYEFDIAAEGRRVGAVLSSVFSNFRDKPTVGAVAVGGLGYAYSGRVLDLMGLCWAEMAKSGSGRRIGNRGHAAFNEEVFFRLSPDIVLPRLAPTNEPFVVGGVIRRVLRGLPTSERFHLVFSPCEIQVERGEKLTFFARRDWLSSQAGLSPVCVIGWDKVLLP